MEEPPRLERPLANVSLKAGEPLRLSCRVAGSRPTIVWLHNSRNLAEARDVQIHRDDASGECSIEVREVFPRHAGIYTLLARNQQGETYTSCNVTLANKPPTETSDSEIASDLELSKPVVRKSLRDQTVNEGRTVRLDCIITGVPEPEVIWYHNSRPIKESSGVKFEFEGDRCSLLISSARQPHQGSYRCKAVNPAGEATSSCKLVVLQNSPAATSSRGGTPSGTSMEVQRLGSAGGPARIVKPLSDVHAKHGEKIRLIVGIECDPPPEVIWSFQGRPILLDGDYVFDHFGNSYILEIPRSTVDHAGTYSVEVRNASGSQHSACRVIVEPLPEDSLALVLAQDGAGDIVSTHVTKSLVSSKKTMLMQKMSSSKSEVTSGGKVVSSEEHQAATTEKHGFEKLGEAAPSEYHSKESFGFDRVGDNPPQHYHTKEVKDNRIQHDGRGAPQLAIEGPAAEGTQPSVLSVTELASQATNVTTRVSEPKQLSVLQRSGSAHIAPKFSKPVQSVAVFLGEQLKLEGWFSGHPEPIVRWSRGSTTLSHKADLQITINKGYTSLVIPKAMQKDHARYTCVISNDVGSSSSAADVVIQTKHEAPQFTRRLDARVCKPGSEVVLEVEVSGVPAPDIKWLRDEVDLKTLNKYDIRSSGNKHTLTMRRSEESDSGRITVLATNTAGEAQSIADIFIEDEGSSEEEREVTIRDYHVEDEKKMEVTMVQAEHLHREQTRIIERQATPKPNVPGLPAPSPSPVPSLDSLFKKDVTEQKETIINTTVDRKRPQEPPSSPAPAKIERQEQITKRIDEEHRVEKHVHTSQSIMKRQQQFIQQNVIESIRFTPTPPPSTSTPTPPKPVEPPKPIEQPKPIEPPKPAPPPPPKPVEPAPVPPPPPKPVESPRPTPPPQRAEPPKPEQMPVAFPRPPSPSPPVPLPPPVVQQRTEVRQQEIIQTKQVHQQIIQQQRQVIQQQQRQIVQQDFITNLPLVQPLPEPPKPLPPPQPPVTTRVMSERKVEKTAEVVKLQKIEPLPPPPPPAPIPLPPPITQCVEPIRKTPEIVKPPKPIEAPSPPMAPVPTKVKEPVKQQPQIIAKPKPVPPPPKPAPPPPPPAPVIAPVAPKPKTASPPPRPPPTPKFRDELLTYDAIRHQEMERIQRQCKKITLIEQRERQTTQRTVTDDRSVLIEESFRKPQPPPVPPPPQLPPVVPSVRKYQPPPPAPAPYRPAEFRVVTEVFQKPRPQNLEEAVTEFYKVHEETSRNVVTKIRAPSLPPERIPVVSVRHLSQPPPPLRRPSPEPVCRLEKRELRLEETRQQRSISPRILQEHVREVKRVPSPTPVCRVQEVDIHRKQVAPPPDHIDVLNLTSTVTHIDRRPSPTPICTLREVDIHRTDKTYLDQTQLVDLHESTLLRTKQPSPTPLCQVNEVDHKVTDRQRVDTTVCVNLTERQPVTPASIKHIGIDRVDKSYKDTMSYVDLHEGLVSRPAPPAPPVLCRVQDESYRFRSEPPPASIHRVDKTYASINKIVDLREHRAPPTQTSTKETVCVVQEDRSKLRRSASESRRHDQSFNIQVTETTPVAPLPLTPIKSYQPMKLVSEAPALPSTPVSVQRLIRTAEWADRARSVDRNVLLTEQFKRRDVLTDNQTTTNLVSQRCYSAPRQVEPPPSASVYIDRHTKVISAPPIAPVQVIPSLPVTRRTDEVSTVSVAVSDTTPRSAPVLPATVPLPAPTAPVCPSGARSAEGQYSFRGFTDSKISRDTSSLMHLEQYERHATKQEEPRVSAISYTGLQREPVVPRQEPQPLPGVLPSTLLAKEPVYRTLPSTSITNKTATNINLLTLHELDQRKVDTTVSTRQDNIQMTLADKISDFRDREDNRHIQATWTLPRKPVSSETKTSLLTRSFEELSTPIQIDTQSVRTARSTPSLKKNPSPDGGRDGDISKSTDDDELTQISAHFKDLLSYTSSIDEALKTNKCRE